ncbi:MAG: gliding motility-associated C-terminal domain-containing protein [Flavobacteriales bacterium]|nr:gliding motility-associated C-terminal domain-containing protein [Flavobacteriales bacterium]
MRCGWLLFFFAIGSFSLSATHIVGGEIGYRYLGNNVYKITLRTYRDCLNGQAPFDQPAIISVYNDAGVLVSNLRVSKYSRYDIPADIYDPCYRVPTGICVELAVYTALDTLDNAQTGYTLSYQRCCRNQTIKNIVNPRDAGTTLTTRIPRRNVASSNSSPVFKREPPLAICLGSTFRFDHSAADADGDILRYSFCTPFVGGGPDDQAPPGASYGPKPDPALPPPYGNISWKSGYTANRPFDANPPFIIDPNTGEITGTPLITGQYVFAVCVEEYRNGKLIGTTRREYQINVTTCVSDVKAVIPPQTEFCVGYSVTFGNNSITAPYFHWDFGVATTQTDTSRVRYPTFAFPDSGLYRIRLIANPGYICADTTYLDYRVNPPVKAQIQPVPGACISRPVFNFKGGGQYETYTGMEWDFGPLASRRHATGLTADSIVFPDTGFYDVRLTLSHAGCRSTAVVRAGVYPHPILDYTLYPMIGCAPHRVDFVGKSKAWTPVHYKWQYEEYAGVRDSFSHVFAHPGKYSVLLTIHTTEGCIDTVGPAEQKVTVLPTPAAGFSLSDAKRSILEPEFEVTDTTKGARSCVLYFGDEYTRGSCGGIYSFSKPGRHRITQIAENIYGCTDTAEAWVEVTDFYSVFIPNTFTPDRDGRNETFYPVVGGVLEILFEVYDRWGHVVFSSRVPNDGWDGTDTRTGNRHPNGVYIYKVHCRDMQGAPHQYSGEVNLIR